MGAGVTVSLRQIYRCQVLNEKQEVMGTVDDVLFHPNKPCAVGFSVKPLRIGGLIALPMRYLLFENTALNEEGQLVVALDGAVPTSPKEEKAARNAWNARAEKTLGFSWDESVIYYGQNVYTTQGALLGKVSDARFDLDSGEVSVLQVTAGTTSDSLLGKRAIPGSMVHGFDAEQFGVICADEAADIDYEGGVAEQAGRATEVAVEAATVASKAATEASKKVGEAALKGAAHAVVYGEKAFKKAAKSDAGKKTKKWFDGFVKDFNEALHDDSDK